MHMYDLMIDSANVEPGYNIHHDPMSGVWKNILGEPSNPLQSFLGLGSGIPWDILLAIVQNNPESFQRQGMENMSNWGDLATSSFTTEGSAGGSKGGGSGSLSGGGK